MSPHDIPMQAQKGGGSIAPTHSQSWRWKGVVSSMFRPLYSRENPCTLCIEVWVIHEDRLGDHGKSRSHSDSIPGSSSPWRTAIKTAARTAYMVKILPCTVRDLRNVLTSWQPIVPHSCHKNLEAAEFNPHCAAISLRFILITWVYINTGIPSGPFFLPNTKKNCSWINHIPSVTFIVPCLIQWSLTFQIKSTDHMSIHIMLLLEVSVQMTHSTSCSQTPSIYAVNFVPDP